MECPYCGHEETKVTNKRDSDESIRRRRECLKCTKRFTTHEKIDSIERYVIKKDGRREPFNRNKILLGIIKACEKREISHDTIEQIVEDIERKILETKKEISTKKIGEMIMKKMKKIDNVAYIRFASVYLDFENVNDFKHALKEVKKE